MENKAFKRPQSMIPRPFYHDALPSCQALHGKGIIHQEDFFDWRLFTFFDTFLCAPMKY
jgi:hypothetical protein